MAVTPFLFYKSYDEKIYEEESFEEEKKFEESSYFTAFEIINIISLTCIWVFFIVLNFVFKNLFYVYLDLNYDKNKNSGNLNNNNENKNNNAYNYKNENKEISIYFGGKNIDVSIEIYKNIYLEEIRTKKKYIFKYILLKGITEAFTYIKINNEGIRNIFSITDWFFPKYNKLFYLLLNIFNSIYFLFFISFLTIIFHANNYSIYLNNKEVLASSSIKYTNIFLKYGNFEKAVTESRFYLYIITMIIILPFIIRRTFYRGFSKLYYSFISLLLSILLNILNIIYFILTLILVIYTSFLLFSENKQYFKIPTVYEIQFSLNLAILLIMILVFYGSISLFVYLLKIFINLKNMNNINNNEIIQTDFIYDGLDKIQYKLKEIQIEGFPRNLFYDLYIMNNNNISKELDNQNIITNTP